MTLSFLRIPEEQFRKDDEMYIPEFICGLAVGVFLGILLIFAIALIAEKIKKKQKAPAVPLTPPEQVAN